MIIKLWQRLLLPGVVSVLFGGVVAQPLQVLASENKQDTSSAKIQTLSEIKFPSTSVQDLVSQSPTADTQSTVIITGVKANPTSKGVEVILETSVGTQLQVTNRSTGNNFIVDVSGGQLRLPSGEAFTFRSEKPLEGITEITVTNVDANTVRVTVVGVAALPTVELFDDNAGLVFAVASTATATSPPQQPQTPQTQEKPASETPQETPSAQGDEPIELVVTGEQDGYRVPDASTATKTDTPLRDIPQSIQVVPRQVIEDRRPRSLDEAVETVSGVLNTGGYLGAPAGGRYIRGFAQSGNFRNGSRDTDYYSLSPIGTVEQVEVLKGPASILFGALEPGGIINVITRQPLSEPYYNLSLEAGNPGFFQPSIDLSGPINDNGTALYRLIAAYRSTDGFQDFVHTNLVTIAPSITVNFDKRTALNLYYEYVNYYGTPEQSTVLLNDGTFTPRDRFLSYPQFNFVHLTTERYGYTLHHQFNDNWQIRNNLAILHDKGDEQLTYPQNFVNDRLLGISSLDRSYTINNYFGQLDVLGRFNTGSVEHQLLLGVDFNRYDNPYQSSTATLPPIDIFDPDYDVPDPDYRPGLAYSTLRDSYGAYLQDQVRLLENLKLLIGGRYDWISQRTTTNSIVGAYQNDGAFSPRIGIVYQPIEPISLFASYSRSFAPTSGSDRNGRAFVPNRGTQYEAGIKADLLDNRLSATLAAYELTKTNVTTPDPVDPNFSVQVGEQRSRGIELDVTGKILPGWNVIVSYAYTNAEVTRDNTAIEGNRLSGIPENQASLWTTYTIQSGDLKDLGFGLGLFYVGERPGNLDNSIELDDYLRTDAAVYYRRGRFRGAINIRNLFDVDYVDTASSRLFINRADPFTITGSISWDF